MFGKTKKKIEKKKQIKTANSKKAYLKINNTKLFEHTSSFQNKKQAQNFEIFYSSNINCLCIRVCV